MVTKDNPQGFATRDDITNITRRLDILSRESTMIINNLANNIERLDAVIQKHDLCIGALEVAV